jgi:6-pyruvoyltetrahydropterin/6-carboxytetrahydropterin synthase
MTMLCLTRTVSFSAAHRYRRADWTEAENRRVFGPNVSLHGHNYRVRVRVSGPLDTRTGMSVDLGLLDRVLEEQVVKPLGWRDLSEGVEGFGDRIPTTENLAIYIWERLQPALAGSMRLEQVRVYESPELYVDYQGSDDPEARR